MVERGRKRTRVDQRDAIANGYSTRIEHGHSDRTAAKAHLVLRADQDCVRDLRLIAVGESSVILLTAPLHPY